MRNISFALTTAHKAGTAERDDRRRLRAGRVSGTAAMARLVADTPVGQQVPGYPWIVIHRDAVKVIAKEVNRIRETTVTVTIDLKQLAQAEKDLGISGQYNR